LPADQLRTGMHVQREGMVESGTCGLAASAARVLIIAVYPTYLAGPGLPGWCFIPRTAMSWYLQQLFNVLALSHVDLAWPIPARLGNSQASGASYYAPARAYGWLRLPRAARCTRELVFSAAPWGYQTLFNPSQPAGISPRQRLNHSGQENLGWPCANVSA